MIITVSSVKLKLCEVYSHFTVLELFEAYGCFICNSLVGMTLRIIPQLNVVMGPCGAHGIPPFPTNMTR